MTVVTGKILTDPGLSQVGTFRADEESLTVDVVDDRAKAKIRKNMGKTWLSDDDPRLLKGGYQDRGKFVKPENIDTLDSFFTMLEATGFIATDIEAEEGD